MEIIFEAYTYDGVKEIEHVNKNAFTLILKDLYEQFKQILKLESLNRIIIPEDYIQGLFELQKQTGHSEYVTKNAYARGWAQDIPVRL